MTIGNKALFFSILPLFVLISLFLFQTPVFASTNTEFETSYNIPIANWNNEFTTINKLRSINPDFDMDYSNYSYLIWGTSSNIYVTIGKGLNPQDRNAIIFGRNSDGVGNILLAGYANSSHCTFQLQQDDNFSTCSNSGNSVLGADDSLGYIIYGLSNVKYAPDGGMTESWFKDWVSSPIIVTPSTPKVSIAPDFTYSLVDKKVLAHDYQAGLPEFTPDDGYTFNGFSVEWNLVKCSTYTETGNLCSDPIQKDYQVLLQDKDYNATVTDYGDYQLTANYLVQQCYRYPSYPATPDYCFYESLITAFPNFDFDPTTVHLSINGQTLTGDTQKLDCDTSGFCQPKVVDCSTESNFFNGLQCRIERDFSFGILNPSLTAFKKLINSFVVPNSPICIINLTDVSIGSSVFPLSGFGSLACNSVSNFRSHFPIMSSMINFFFALSLVYLIVRIINRVLDDKQSNIIEGIK